MHFLEEHSEGRDMRLLIEVHWEREGFIHCRANATEELWDIIFAGKSTNGADHT